MIRTDELVATIADLVDLAPRATGNIPTEDLVYLLHGMGVSTGVHLEALMATSLWLGEQLGKELPAMVTRAGAFP